MAKDKKYLALELQIEEQALKAGGMDNIELLVQNWAEQQEFTQDELNQEKNELQSVIACVAIYKAAHPEADTIQALLGVLAILQKYHENNK